MGSSSFPARVIPISEQKPKGRRVHLAPLIAEDLLKWTVENIIMDPTYQGKERECYEVSLQFRNQEHPFRRIVNEYLPGGDLPRSDGARNRITLTDRIVMVFMDFVNANLIRPGPTPEDRNSYDIRDEMFAAQSQLSDLIARVIEVEDKHEGLSK